MLSELRIRNLAVVEDAVIRFKDGLNVLTGSTGAGKSIILTAVDLLSGGRARRSLIRRGAAVLTVEGVFTVPDGSALRGRPGIGSADTRINLRREFSADGRSRIWINGAVSTNAVAQEIARALLELHGQHRQQELLDSSNHILYLDGWGVYQELLATCMRTIEAYREGVEHMHRLRTEAEKFRREEEFLRFQLRELDALHLEPDLDRELERRIKRREHAVRYIAGLEELQSLLDGEDGSVLAGLARAEKVLGSLASVDGRWAPAVSQLGEVRISVQEIARQVERAAVQSGEQPEDIEVLQEKLSALQRACRKYGLDCNGLIERKREIERILRSLADGSDEIIEAQRAVQQVRGELCPLLDRLSRERRNSARRLDRAVTAELAHLGMKGALFRTRIARIREDTVQGSDKELPLTPRGWDEVTFEIRTNIGEETHPLSEVVSGGELSRITLVLKELQVEEKGISTLIFDEIDAGLGADLGGVVAERLSELASRYQIICITHVPQVAARADQHVVVTKRVKGKRTATSARVISGEERIAEIARMLGGRGRLREDLAFELLSARTGARSSDG